MSGIAAGLPTLVDRDRPVSLLAEPEWSACANAYAYRLRDGRLLAEEPPIVPVPSTRPHAWHPEADRGQEGYGECPICYQFVSDNSPAVQLSCPMGHVFHHRCLDGYPQHVAKCAMCRVPCHIARCDVYGPHLEFEGSTAHLEWLTDARKLFVGDDLLGDSASVRRLYEQSAREELVKRRLEKARRECREQGKQLRKAFQDLSDERERNDEVHDERIMARNAVGLLTHALGTVGLRNHVAAKRLADERVARADTAADLQDNRFRYAERESVVAKAKEAAAAHELAAANANYVLVHREGASRTCGGE